MIKIVIATELEWLATYDCPIEAALSMANVEQYAAFAGSDDCTIKLHFPFRCVDNGAGETVESVSVHITTAQRARAT